MERKGLSKLHYLLGLFGILVVVFLIGYVVYCWNL